jgi:hypothetical protein
MLLQFTYVFSEPVNLFRLIAILCIFLVPFFLAHNIGRGFERIQKAKSRFSYLFWLALIFTLAYIVWYTAWGSYSLWGRNLSLVMSFWRLALSSCICFF